VTRSTGALSKVPHVTLAFWLIKICATTVGETGADALSMTLGLGYALSGLIFLGFLAVTVAAQVTARRYHAFLYWAVVVATTTVGTALSDYLDRTLGLGYPRSSAVLFCGVIAVLLLWRRVTGAIEFEDITTRGNEIFYWLTILVANTLGTALGDFVGTSTGLGFEEGALVFAGLLALVAAAYVLTRPLGATLGDTLTKPTAEGGLALGRISSSAAIAVAMIAIIASTRLRKRAVV